jgi:hypothetical protein
LIAHSTSSKRKSFYLSEGTKNLCKNLLKKKKKARNSSIFRKTIFYKQILIFIALSKFMPHIEITKVEPLTFSNAVYRILLKRKTARRCKKRRSDLVNRGSVVDL